MSIGVRSLSRLQITVFEITGLARSLSQAGCYVEVSVTDGAQYNETERTTCMCGEKSFLIVEKFNFEMPDSVTNSYTTYIDLKTDKSKILGSVKMNLEGNSSYQRTEEWYSFEPVKKGRSSKFVRIRIGTRYMEDVLLLPENYTPLFNTVLSDMDLLVHISKIISSEDYHDFGRYLIEIFHISNPRYLILFIETLLIDLIRVTDDQNVLFRESSFAAKLFEEFLNLFGKEWKQKIILPSIEKLVGPNRINLNSKDPGASLFIKPFLLDMVNTLYLSDGFPPEIQYILSVISETTTAKFHDEEVTHMSVSSFIILRLLSPSILNPKDTGIIAFETSPEENKNFKTLSSFLQKLGNLSLFRSNVPNLAILNEILTAEEDNMIDFILDISKPVDLEFKEEDGNIEDVYVPICRLARLLVKNRDALCLEVEKNRRVLPEVDNIIRLCHMHSPNYWSNQKDLSCTLLKNMRRSFRDIDPSSLPKITKKRKASRSDFTNSAPPRYPKGKKNVSSPSIKKRKAKKNNKRSVQEESRETTDSSPNDLSKFSLKSATHEVFHTKSMDVPKLRLRSISISKRKTRKKIQSKQSRSASRDMTQYIKSSDGMLEFSKVNSTFGKLRPAKRN